MSISETRLGGGEPAAARKAWLTPLVGMGLWLASVAVLTGLVSGVLWTLQGSGVPTQAELDRWQWGSREQKLATLREAYSGRRPVITDPRRDEIEKFLKELTKSESSVGEGPWIDALDEVRFRRRMLDSPWGRSLSWFERRQFTALPISNYSVVTPNQMHDIKLLHIAPAAGGDETLVFTLAQQEYHDAEPMLFWLSKSSGSWKLVDWEWVDSGWTESEASAHWIVMSEDPLGGGYERAMLSVREADSFDYTKKDEYEQKLREAENCGVPSAAADYTRYLIMHRWSNRNRPEEVLRLSASVLEPDRVPGVHLLRALACQRLGKTDEAFAALDRLEQLVGFRPRVVQARAYLFHQARRRGDALTQWRRLADFDPGDASSLSELLELLPKSQRSEVIDRIKTHSEPLKLAAEIVQFNRSELDERLLQDLSQFAQSLAPESAEARQIEIARLEIQDQYAAAAALSRQAAERESDKVKQQSHWYSYLTQMHRAGELVRGFAAHPDPKVAFHILVGGLDDNESIIDLADLPPLLAAYRAMQPDDPWLSYYEGYYAAQKQRFAEADRRFAEAERLLPPSKPAVKPAAKLAAKLAAAGVATPEDEEGKEDEDGELDGLRELLRDQRCRAQYELGQAVEALDEYKHHESAYQSLARLAVQYCHWNLLNQLNQSFASKQPQSLWLTYYEARYLLAIHNFKAVRLHVRLLNARQKEAPGIEYYTEQLELELLLKEVPDPIAAYQRSKDHATTFHRLSQKMLDEHDWDHFDKLCQINRVGSNSPEVVRARLEQAWRQRDDLGLIRLLIPWPTPAFVQRNYLEGIWRERLVRSLLRQNRWDEAHQFAQEAYQRHEEPWPLVMTEVARNDVAAIAQRLSEDESFAESWTHRDFATDPFLRAVLLDDTFAELRQQQLFALPNYRDGETLTLLLSQPLELSESWLRNRLGQPGLPPEIQIASETRASVTWEGRRFELLAMPTPYFSAEDVEHLVPPSSRRLPSNDRYEVFLRQRAHLLIVPLRDDRDEPWNSPTISVRELGAKLMSRETIGVVYDQSTNSSSFLAAISSSNAKGLASRRPLSEINPSGFVLRARDYDFQLPPEEQQTLRKRVESNRAEANSPPLLVEVRMLDAPIPMLESFRVSDIRRHRFGGYELIAEYAGSTPSPHFPELRPGLKFIIPLHQVHFTH
ncbi:MAG: hypothetical protein ACKV2Q_07995 [Planctomycetaceae bacterium]